MPNPDEGHAQEATKTIRVCAKCGKKRAEIDDPESECPSGFTRHVIVTAIEEEKRRSL